MTWTLTKVDGGTHLKLVHDGFIFPGNKFAFDAMSPGWGRLMDSIARVTAERSRRPREADGTSIIQKWNCQTA